VGSQIREVHYSSDRYFDQKQQDKGLKSARVEFQNVVYKTPRGEILVEQEATIATLSGSSTAKAKQQNINFY
jgi:hypothetical protein